MKKNFLPAVILLASLFLLLCIQPVSATSGPTIKAGSVNAAPGETVDVDITIENNPGVLGAILQVSFPSDLKLTAIKPGDVFSELTMTNTKQLVSPFTIVWDGEKISSDKVKDGVIATLTFQVSNITMGGNFKVELLCAPGGCIDGDLNPIQITCKSGAVKVVPPVEAKGIETNGALTVKVTSQNEIKNAILIGATYGKDGQMLSCDVQKINLPKGDSSFSLKNKAKNTTCAAYLMDGSLHPLCPKISFPSGTK